MNLETARKILIDILKAIALPENSKKLSDAKCKKNVFLFSSLNLINNTFLNSTEWKRDGQILPTSVSISHGDSNECCLKLWIYGP